LILFDTHAHLWESDFDSDRHEVLTRARAAGVREVLNLGTTVATSRACLELAEQEPLCWAAVGLHPNELQEYAADPEGEMAAVEDLCHHPRVVAIGETGLDFQREPVARTVQRAALRDHLELGRRTGLPVVLHNRLADVELREAVETWGEGVTAVFHCFTGDESFGRWAIEHGHYLGLGGVLTFRSSDLRERVGAWDLDGILLETDSPYLAPAPHRGKRNEPALIALTARALADAVGLDRDELAERTRANAFRAFPKCAGVS
jgi:TatD DNase family protein